MARTYCRKCGKPIEFIRTAAGKHMPVEPYIVHAYNNPDGNMTVITEKGKTIRAISAHMTDRAAIVAYIPHWQRCSGAEDIHKEQKAAVEQRKPESVIRKLGGTTPVDAQIKLF